MVLWCLYLHVAGRLTQKVVDYESSRPWDRRTWLCSAPTSDVTGDPQNVTASSVSVISAGRCWKRRLDNPKGSGSYLGWTHWRTCHSYHLRLQCVISGIAMLIPLQPSDLHVGGTMGIGLCILLIYCIPNLHILRSLEIISKTTSWKPKFYDVCLVLHSNLNVALASRIFAHPVYTTYSPWLLSSVRCSRPQTPPCPSLVDLQVCHEPPLPRLAFSCLLVSFADMLQGM